MKYKYHIIPQARDEYRIAREWYKQQHTKGLGNSFARAVKECILKIQQNPFAFAIRYKNVRVAHTHKFPYSVHFYFENNKIIITSIIYQGRNPLIAMNRV